MASSSFNQARDSRLNSSRRCSTAQACLRRILHTIATCPNSAGIDLAGGNAASLGIDLALRLGSVGSPDVELLVGESDLTVEKSSEEGLEQSKACEFGDCDDQPERSNFDGFLGMLVEAARWVSGGFGDGDGSESEGQSHHAPAGREEQEEGASGGGGVAEARRSERGRKRVMPGRYRDSVMEPYWKRMPPRRGGGGGCRANKGRGKS